MVLAQPTDATASEEENLWRGKRKRLALDLFCGCGGLSEGLVQAGFDVIGAIDLDPVATEAYGLNHAEDQLHQADITLIDGQQWMEILNLGPGDLDLLAGCPPCQGFSTIRTKNGGRSVVDPQNDLIFEFLRLVEDFMPKAIMLENVPGLAEDWRMKRFKRRLRQLGYRPRHWVLNAADYMVPQRRKRLILLAGYEGTIRRAKKCQKRRTVREAIGKLAGTYGKSGDFHHDLTWNRTKDVQERIESIPKDGGSRSALGEDKQLECHRRMNGFKDIYGRLAWDDVSSTITTGCFNPSKGRFLHPEQDRPITLREAALLQSFPPDYKFPERGKEKIARLIGNALPPEFIRRHALMIQQFINKQPRA